MCAAYQVCALVPSFVSCPCAVLVAGNLIWSRSGIRWRGGCFLSSSCFTDGMLALMVGG